MLQNNLQDFEEGSGESGHISIAQGNGKNDDVTLWRRRYHRLMSYHELFFYSTVEEESEDVREDPLKKWVVKIFG